MGPHHARHSGDPRERGKRSRISEALAHGLFRLGAGDKRDKHKGV